jgi:hypothetical protein
MALTLTEAREAALKAHPGWRSDDIDRLARGMVASAEKLEALDAMNAEVDRLQTEADAQNAADYDPGAPLGRVGGSADPWAALRGDREANAWQRFAEDAAEAEAKQAQRANENAAPDGWRY